jgi:hypothetical protein
MTQRARIGDAGRASSLGRHRQIYSRDVKDGKEGRTGGRVRWRSWSSLVTFVLFNRSDRFYLVV